MAIQAIRQGVENLGARVQNAVANINADTVRRVAFQALKVLAAVTAGLLAAGAVSFVAVYISPFLFTVAAGISVAITGALIGLATMAAYKSASNYVAGLMQRHVAPYVLPAQQAV